MALDTILVAIGRGDEEPERLERLAEVIGEYEEAAHPEFVLLHVFDSDERDELAGEMDVDADADSDLIARRHSVTRELTDRLDTAGANFTVRGRVSNETAEAVVQVADAVGADRIITLGRTRTPTGKVVFGSVSQQILLHAHCPVTYVGVE
jgi:nucleotide-binding universal stress UspA family protein